MAKPSQFRLSDHTLADLDALAAGLGGVRSAALRDAVHHWHRLVEDAGKANAEDFSKDDWTRLAHLNDPNPLPPGVMRDDDPIAPDWSRRFAADLVGMWEGKPLLPMHRAEKKECERLAKKVGGIGPIRGYAMYLALSHFWGPVVGTPGDGEWWHVETFMTPTAKEPA